MSYSDSSFFLSTLFRVVLWPESSKWGDIETIRNDVEIDGRDEGGWPKDEECSNTNIAPQTLEANLTLVTQHRRMPATAKDDLQAVKG
jgi:hypothetical protein